MHLTPEQMKKMMATHLQAKALQAPVRKAELAPASSPSSLSLLPLLPYVPVDRDQGWCGDCWAWAGTGVMEIAHNVQNGVANRLSVQFLNTCNPYVGCCEGGWLQNVADFYNDKGFAVPWSNTNGNWTSGDGSCGASCGSVAIAPQYGITSMSVVTIPTWGVSQAQAIANVKAALNQNQAVWFAFFMGSETDWDNFDSFWEYQPESTQWTNFNSGEAYTTGGGHAILCVGYNDNDPAGPTWIMLNSWGTTSDRPDGVLHISENINYDGVYTYGSYSYQQLYFETLDIQFTPPPTYALAINTNGTGSVLMDGTNAPSTITIPSGETVSLAAQGNFVGWSGSQNGASTNLQLVMTNNISLTANFQNGKIPLAPILVTQPAAQNLPVGGNLVLSVAGYGIPAPTFSWSMGGHSVGSGTSTLTLTNVSATNQGTYSCLLSNTAGKVQSASVLVNVDVVPAIVGQPVSQVAALGGRATFTATANCANVTCQWYKAGSALAGGTNASLAISNAQSANAGSYWLVITNPAIARSATSSVVTLTVVSMPVISVQPSGTNILLGTSATLSVSASGGCLSYIWKMGDSTVQSGSNNFYLINSSIAGTANYTVVVSNGAGSATSSLASVSVIVPPTITMPANKNLAVGSNWTISPVCANLAGTYAWFFNASNVLNSKTNCYTVTNAAKINAGAYSLVLSNMAGVASGTVTLSVFSFPSIVSQPAAANILPSGASVGLVVGATGDSLGYQWSRNSTAIPGAINPTLAIASLAVTNSGTYTVVVSNAVGKVTSQNSVLTVIPPPAIVIAPKTQSLVVNQPLNLSVVATGTAPCTNLTYQWQFGTNIANATNAAYSIANMSSNWAGKFTVVVSNFGGATNSSAVVTLIPDTNRPQLAVVVPAKAVTNSPYTLTGTVTDLVALTNVAFSLDGGAHFTNAATSNGWNNWSASLPLQIVTNTVIVVASDTNGLSATNTAKIEYQPFFAAVLTTNGSGAGIVTGFANRMQYGVAYTLTAAPAARNLFQYWSGFSGISTTSSTNAASLTFTVTNTVGITVSFATNQFFNQAGAYNGLFCPSNGATHQTAGFLNVTITTNLTYSGKALFEGQAISISGSLNTNGTASLALNPDVTLAFALTNQQLIGTVSAAGWTSFLTADMALFSSSNPNTQFAGNFDIVIPPDANGTVTNGYGCGAVSVSANGALTFVGSAADGTALSQSVPLSQEGWWPLFVQIYSANKTNTAGEILGWINFPANGAPSGSITWIKTGYTNTGSYSAGLTNYSPILSSTFTAPAKSSPNVLKGMTNGESTFVGGNLTNSFQAAVSITTNGSVYCYNSTMTLAFTSSGLFSGTFLDNGTGRTASFSGAALQNTTNAYGYFTGTNKSGSFTLVPLP
ncbi:MAG: immunoglobulin domain-containing protein [Verrucomicrobiota bacterium]